MQDKKKTSITFSSHWCVRVSFCWGGRGGVSCGDRPGVFVEDRLAFHKQPRTETEDATPPITTTAANGSGG